MRIEGCRIFRYRLPLARPLPLAGGAVRERTGLLVRVQADSGAWGWGDAAPLPGFSRESVDDAAAEFTALARRLGGAGFEPGGGDLESWLGREPPEAASPSVRFGLETALASLSRRMRTGTDGELPGFDGAVPVNGLLMGSREEVLRQAARLGDAGCRAVKLKVGSRGAAEDAELTRAVRAAVGQGVSLRLDANRSWSLEQAVAFGKAAGDAGVEYLEEPLRDPARLGEFFDATGIPVGLDESLLELGPDDLEGRQEVGAVVLKPTLLGGAARAREWAAKALALGVRPVASGCFESGVGTLAVAGFAWDSTGAAVPAGLDTYRWLDADVVRPRIRFRPDALSWNDDLARDHRIDCALLREARHD